jgi:hypothetical protein
MRAMNLRAAYDFPVPEKRMAGQIVRPNFDKTPNWSVLFSSAEPGAIMRQLSPECQPFHNCFCHLATIVPKRVVSFRFQLPRQCFKHAQ